MWNPASVQRRNVAPDGSEAVTGASGDLGPATLPPARIPTATAPRSMVGRWARASCGCKGQYTALGTAGVTWRPTVLCPVHAGAVPAPYDVRGFGQGEGNGVRAVTSEPDTPGGASVIPWPLPCPCGAKDHLHHTYDCVFWDRTGRTPF